jgi:uncharacterized protein YjbI with pentapeptide repeats
VVALGFVAPVLAISAPSPASADTVLDGCTIVSNPTATNFTNCPGVDLAGSDLSAVDLRYADLARTRFADCNFLSGSCDYANLDGANLTNANLTKAVFFDSTSVPPRGTDTTSGVATLNNANL